MLAASYQYDKSCLYNRAVLLPFTSDAGTREAALYDRSCMYLCGTGLGAPDVGGTPSYSGSTAALIIGGAAAVLGIAAALTTRK